MTETLAGVSPSSTEELLEQPSLAEAAVAGAAGSEDVDGPGELAEPSTEELGIARELVRSARARGVAMTGPGGMLKALTKMVIETALGEELTDHLGYEKHEPTGRGSGNSRNGDRVNTVLTDNVGLVQIEVPRDRDGTFDPVIVKKRQWRLGGVDTIVLSLVAKGLTTGEVSAHLEEIYGASLSKDTISRITDRVLTEMTDWAARPLEKVYAAVFIDAIYVKVRDGQVANRPFYAAIGVDLAGHKDVLGIWAGAGGGESAKFWLQVLSEPKNRGVEDVFFVVCDRLKGLPDSVGAVVPQAVVQTCIIHLIRNTFRNASKKYWGQIATDLKPIYRAPSREAGWAAFEKFEQKWDKPYPAIGQLWRRRLGAVRAVLGLRRRDPHRAVLDERDRVVSLNARYRRAVTVRGHLPTEQAAMKCLYLVTRSLDPKGTGQTRWTVRWKPALNAFAITFGDRMPKGREPLMRTAAYTVSRTDPASGTTSCRST
ncbi:IS256 family transposase [Georgenia muralis]|uniref:Transposase-like protein n=1 Tax=Georgenia muralis TaxID=154117 RepID=A0A3N4Z9S4_9MICO|nr:IS256 family transposase [Georgenia muralis]RPF28000.1 transposase-like protein [Georgenia muralis]